MQFKFKPGKTIFKFTLEIGLGALVIFVLGLTSVKSIPAMMLLGVLFVLYIPGFILFIEYYANDCRSEFVFERSNNRLVYIKGKKTQVYTIEQIDSITLTGTAARLRKDGVFFFYNHDYFHYTFYFNNGDSVVLTSLLLNRKLINEANFKEIKFEKQVKILSFIDLTPTRKRK